MLQKIQKNEGDSSAILVKDAREQQQYEYLAEYNYILHVTSLIPQKQGVADQAWVSTNADTTETRCATYSTWCCTETLQSTIWWDGIISDHIYSPEVETDSTKFWSYNLQLYLHPKWFQHIVLKHGMYSSID